MRLLTIRHCRNCKCKAYLSCWKLVICYVQAAEQIVVLEAGQVKEVGTHDELVKRNGVYAGLVSSTSLSLSTSV